MLTLLHMISSQSSEGGGGGVTVYSFLHMYKEIQKGSVAKVMYD